LDDVSLDVVPVLEWAEILETAPFCAFRLLKVVTGTSYVEIGTRNSVVSIVNPPTRLAVDVCEEVAVLRDAVPILWYFFEVSLDSRC
jgi:hypothetical protein